MKTNRYAFIPISDEKYWKKLCHAAKRALEFMLSCAKITFHLKQPKNYSSTSRNQ